VCSANLKNFSIYEFNNVAQKLEAIRNKQIYISRAAGDPEEIVNSLLSVNL
jgi:hypothetical protein